MNIIHPRHFTSLADRAASSCSWLYSPAGGRRTAAAQEPLRSTVDEEQKKHGSDVKDTAGLFDVRRGQAARKELERIEHETNVATVIQTVESLGGQKIADGRDPGGPRVGNSRDLRLDRQE